MGARVDKTDSAVGVVRAALAADIPQARWNTPIGMGINAAGLAVVGAGNTGIVGVAIFDRTNYKTAQIADIFVLADVVGCEGLTAGTAYYSAAADGAMTTTTTDTPIGWTVEADRLIVRK